MDYQTVLECYSIPLPGTTCSKVYKRTHTLTWLLSFIASAYTQHTAPPRHYLGVPNTKRIWCSTTSSKSSRLPAPGVKAAFPVLGRSASGRQEPGALPQVCDDAFLCSALVLEVHLPNLEDEMSPWTWKWVTTFLISCHLSLLWASSSPNYGLQSRALKHPYTLVLNSLYECNTERSW